MTTTVDWSVPGCHEVVPGCHRIPLTLPQDGLRAVNVYALAAADGLVLVDGGWRVDGALAELADGLARIGRGLADVRDVLVTHVHRDHYTLATALRREHGARVWLGRHERENLEAVRALGSNVPTTSLRELHRAGLPGLADTVAADTAGIPFDAADWEAPDGWLDAGPVEVAGRRLEVVHTPGHTRGHVVLHDLDAGVLFSGDHVLPRITPSIGFELDPHDLPLEQFLASLELLLSRPDALLAPAHGHPGAGVHQRVRELLAHHRTRLEQTAAVLVDHPGGATGAAVARALPWTRRETPLPELDDVNQMFAVCETLAHLDLLVARGAATSTGGPVPRFGAA